ncbi:ATP-binding protein [Phormidium sp. CLA17]|uniref:slr1658 superfamily regulator n=1 Tax=Leptolyngbya sp. Cla-17 TaxID=2803751 RepID=UPI001492D0E4|nr:ATP-binding protein [Leptolyngbya sp. Cla-17]MBM0741127.1 ATP-binding protein [Leptolyngbya sp. Cla-17]
MTQASVVQTFGDFIQQVPSSQEYLTLNFSPTAAARKQRWRNYGLSADFLGDYFAAFFPGDTLPDSKINQRDSVKAAVSYVANELLENAVKYNDDSTGLPVSISLHLYERQIIFHVINFADSASAEKYQAFVQVLLTSDLDEFYMTQLERTATGEGGSSMGVLTMMNDYSAQFGWQFQTLESMPNVVKVDVMAYLNV